MSTIFLATVWLLHVMPVATPQMPDPKEFRVGSVMFSSVEDCDVAGKKWIDTLTSEAYGNRATDGALKWGAPSTAPAGATVTFTCIAEIR